ncbi:unnamed protein product [Cuscuta epithymum]|uniref:Uncharacterized protein n=1 Tax=Cuscuta epithymum TaxID=186058 RepID=A0AAV0GIX0_9ASTE|nr:unnamed protein product [Cuscuta epithymum]CAH9147907.1 unnamed protein product [Cuscuta epithymum]
MSASSGCVNGPRREICGRGKKIILKLLEDRRKIEELTIYLDELRMAYDGRVEQKIAMYQAERKRHNLKDEEQKKEDTLANQFDLCDEIIQDNDALRSFLHDYFPH